MSKSPLDHQRDHTIATTEGFLADIYGEDLRAITGEQPLEVQADPPAESSDENRASPRPSAPPVEDAIDVEAADDSAHHLDMRPSSDDPIDLDGPSDSRDQFGTQDGPDTHDLSTSTAPDGDETPLPGSDLVDQLTTGSHTDDAANSAAESKRNPRYNKRIAMGFGAATVAATLVVSGALLAMRSDPHTSDPPQPVPPNTRLSVLAAPSSTSTAPDNQDSTIPYTATAVGCLPGSTASQSVAGTDSTQAWVCVTGGNVGQYLIINLGRTMVVTAVSITPGWVGADASGADQWHQHRVLTRVQWSFNDTTPTAVPQETGSVHGEATKPMANSGVLASRIIMLVQETGRAPADTTSTSPTPGGGGVLGEVLGPPAAPADPTPTSSTPALPGMPADASHTDPADNTFAVSSIKIFGHSPLHQ
ncbi:hypothetical protein QRB40_24075 [Mycobacterium intracellulare subsp. chimaera]|uniref:hypothetical protein n=2 Tax=Mycobacterium intracellulare TaxID=1767 RepID=UPI0006CA80A7|nr:hypothetical protein [Mycobacterium intracellulare]MDM3908852.1 hypothetical protein [Mycobacterium intracellulare subsp. chimaera]